VPDDAPAVPTDPDTVRGVAAPDERLVAAHRALDKVDRVRHELLAVRAEAVIELRDGGWEWADIGAQVGVTYQRAQQMARQGTGPANAGPARKHYDDATVEYPT